MLNKLTVAKEEGKNDPIDFTYKTIFLGANLLNWRIPGVLQRFGVCYFVIASLNLSTSPSENTLLVRTRKFTNIY